VLSRDGSGRKQRANSQAQLRADFSRDATEATEAHSQYRPERLCHIKCTHCETIRKLDKDLVLALDPLDGTAMQYQHRKLQTKDAVQRDRTFGRLIKIFIPRGVRLVESEILEKYEYRMRVGWEYSVEKLLRGAAVARLDLAYNLNME
jgi:hypothetical protein